MAPKSIRAVGKFSFAAVCIGLFSAAISDRQANAATTDPVVAPASVPGIPLLSTSPGAAYTIYLDFGGFNFTGTWGSNSGTPGITPAYDTDGNGASFSAGEVNNMRSIWARIAQKFVGMNVNVTTVDPAVAAGQAGSDSSRQAYYDSTARMMHTVIGGNGAWSGGGGVSFIGATKNSYTTAGVNGGAGPGFHTDFVFAGLSPNNTRFIGEATAHENGHGFGLNHQSDYTGSSLVNEYSTNNDASGIGTYAPIMGASYPISGHTNNVQRGTWRSGNSHVNDIGPTAQNDVATIVGNPGMGGYVDDAVGHNRITASPLPLAGGAIDPNLARGWINPVSLASPNPLGAGNYTTDFFSFQSDGINPISLTVTDGTEFLAVGSADPGTTLNSTLKILNGTGGVVGTAITAADTLSETFNSLLPAGTYYAQIQSNGGYTSTFDTSAQYYDMGAYFVTGAVPEPTTMLTVISLAGLMLRRRCD